MRLRPAATLHRDRSSPSRRLAFTVDSDLGAIILRMIASNSLSAFTPAISQREPVQPVRGTTPAQPGGAGDPATALQRKLETVPPQPTRPMPRGSLLDLRV